MPYRRTRFYKDGFYHVYNRGVEKRDIFLDDADYTAFLSIIHAYISPPKTSLQQPVQGRALRIREHQLDQEIQLLAYCLMPNHFHLLVKQKLASSVTNFMRRFLTAYSMYFNERYNRVGSLFQGRFKAKEVEKEEYILHLSRYIHRNPLKVQISRVGDLKSFCWSSYPYYLGKVKSEIANRDFLLGFFPNESFEAYRKFVEFDSEDKLPDGMKFEE